MVPQVLLLLLLHPPLVTNFSIKCSCFAILSCEILHGNTSSRSCVAFSGETIFTDRMDKAATLLRVHIEKGCLHDPNPEHVELVQIVGRTKDGLDLIRSLRGTNRVETYHQKLGQLMGSYKASATMAHYTMLLYNTRRNHHMAGAWHLHDSVRVFCFSFNSHEASVGGSIRDTIADTCVRCPPRRCSCFDL